MGWRPLTVAGIDVLYNDSTPEVRVFADKKTAKLLQSNIAIAVFNRNSEHLEGNSYRDLSWVFYTGTKKETGVVRYHPSSSQYSKPRASRESMMAQEAEDTYLSKKPFGAYKI